jgi:hypothetical protein
MSGIQSLLAIGAVLLFGLVSLRFNSAVIQNISLEVQNKVYLTAFSLADDVIEEIKQKAFDECTADGKLKVVALSSLTDPALLGKESGENWPDFNDIDDYNKYPKSVGLPYLEGFNVFTTVRYANPTDFSDTTYTSRSFFKRVDVTVSSQYLSTPVHLNFIFSLHSKLKEE